MAVTTFMSPIVTFSEIDQSAYVAASPIGSVGGTVGTFQWGPVDEVLSVGDERTLADIFGLPHYKKSTPELNRYIDWFSCSNFLAYSRNLKVARCCYPHAKNATVQLNYEFLYDAYGDIIGIDALRGIQQLSEEIQDEILVKNNVDYENLAPTVAEKKVAFVAKYPGCFPNGIIIAIAGNDGYKEIKDEFGTRLSDKPMYAEFVEGQLGQPNYIKVTILHPEHKFVASSSPTANDGDYIEIKGVQFAENGILPEYLNGVHKIESTETFIFDSNDERKDGPIPIEGYTFHIQYTGTNPIVTQMRYFAGLTPVAGFPGITSGFYEGKANSSGTWEWKISSTLFDANIAAHASSMTYGASSGADPSVFRDIDPEKIDRGQLGGDDTFVYKHSVFWPSAYKSIFTSEPVPGEFHILLIDPTGDISGTRLPGTILEKFESVSIQPSKKYDGSSNYISNVINRGSKFINVGDISYLTDDFVHDSLVLQGGDDNMFNYAFPEGSSFNISGKRTFFDFSHLKIILGTITPYPANRQYSHITFRQAGNLYQGGDAINLIGYQCEWGKDPNTWTYQASFGFARAEYEKQCLTSGNAINYPLASNVPLITPKGAFSKAEDERVNGKVGTPRTIVWAEDDYYHVEMNMVRVEYPPLNIIAIDCTDTSAYVDPAGPDPATYVYDSITHTGRATTFFGEGSSGLGGQNVIFTVGCAEKTANNYYQIRDNNAFFNDVSLNPSLGGDWVATAPVSPPTNSTHPMPPEKPNHYLHSLFGTGNTVLFKAAVEIYSPEAQGYQTHEVWGTTFPSEKGHENQLILHYSKTPGMYPTQVENIMHFPWDDGSGNPPTASMNHPAAKVYKDALGVTQFDIIGHSFNTSSATPRHSPWTSIDNSQSALTANYPGFPATLMTMRKGSIGTIRIKEFYLPFSTTTKIDFPQPIPRYNKLNCEPPTNLTTNENVSYITNQYQQNILRLKTIDSTNTGTLAMRLKTWDLFLDEDRVDANLLFVGEGGPRCAKWVIENVCLVRKDCITMVDPFYSDCVGVASPVDIIRRLKKTREMFFSTSYGVMVSAWKYQYDRFNDEYHWLPLGGDIAGLCSRVDYDLFPWYSPAGLNRGHIKNIIKLSHHEPLYMRDELYINGINPVVSFPNEGIVLYGDKTLQTKASAFDRINVRRLFIFLERSIVAQSRYFLFELNDAYTREVIRQMIGSFMSWVMSNRGCYAYKVVCDETNNTNEIIDRNELYADIFVQPVKSINFIQLNFIATRTGASMTIIGNN